MNKISTESLAGLIAILQLEVTQMQLALHDNDCAMSKLIDAHATLTDHLPPDESSAEVQAALREMIINFQEHDALNQRMEHITNALNSLGELLQDDATLQDPKVLAEFTRQRQQLYTMEAERKIHDAVTHQKSESDTASKSCATQEPGSIELF